MPAPLLGCSARTMAERDEPVWNLELIEKMGSACACGWAVKCNGKNMNRPYFCRYFIARRKRKAYNKQDKPGEHQQMETVEEI